MPWLRSSWRPTAPSTGRKKLGQPVPESKAVAESNRCSPQPARTAPALTEAAKRLLDEVNQRIINIPHSHEIEGNQLMDQDDFIRFTAIGTDIVVYQY